LQASRRYDPLGADAAFADAFDEAHQDHEHYKK
jgi:hypothetical protein